MRIRFIAICVMILFMVGFVFYARNKTEDAENRIILNTYEIIMPSIDTESGMTTCYIGDRRVMFIETNGILDVAIFGYDDTTDAADDFINMLKRRWGQ